MRYDLLRMERGLSAPRPQGNRRGVSPDGCNSGLPGPPSSALGHWRTTIGFQASGPGKK
jgi:hypothetical protein